MYRNWLAMLVAICLMPSLSDRDTSAAERPNIILINVDDLGYGDLPAFNSKSPNQTPHVDRLAREGRKLLSHYAAPVCSPSRAALMTGCYPKRVLPIPHVLFPAAAVGLHPDEVTLAEVLKSAGYATACFGKWHLGDQPEFLPTRQGFDEYFGLPYSNDMGTLADGSKSNFGVPIPNRPLVGQVAVQGETGILGLAQPPLPLLDQETVVERVKAAEQATLTARYTARAVRFIEKHQQEPFFIYLPHSAVHFPLYPAAEFRERENTTLMRAWIEEVDASLGQILAALTENKLDRKTLVLFTSDNGGHIRHGSSNGVLRGEKGSTWEGGVRVPLIAWWPGQIEANTESDEITSMPDILPTLASVAGATLAPERKLDGLNLWDVLSGTVQPAMRREVFYIYRGLKLEAVRSGDWKLHFERKELFNLRDDLSERKNLAAELPEVVERLTRLASAVTDDLGLEGVGPGCRPLGRVRSPLPLIDTEGHIRTGFEPRPPAK